MCEYCNRAAGKPYPRHLIEGKYVTDDVSLQGDIEVQCIEDHLVGSVTYGSGVIAFMGRINYCPMCGGKLIHIEGP